MQPPTVLSTQKRFLIFLAGLSLIGMVLGGIATSRYGSGVASDSVKYLAVAQSLVDGNGLFDHRGSPLLSWPPLYSIVLAGLSAVFRLDVFVTGWGLNVFMLGLNLFLSGVLFWRIFQTQPLYAYLASGFVLLSISSLRIHATILSEPLYLTMTLVLLIILDAYIRQRSVWTFIGMVVLSMLAPVLRYVGLAVTVTALVVILVENRKAVSVLLRDGFILGLLSILPIGWWILFHNIMTYGTLFGTAAATVDVYQNTVLALTKMLHWFIPYFTFVMPLLVRPLLVIGMLFLALLLINLRRRQNWFAWLREFTLPSTYPTMIYAIVYFSAVASTIITGDHRSLYSDRYYVILLVPTMVLVFITFDRLIRTHLRFSAQWVNYGLAAVFCLWAIYPLYGMREYLANALERGEPSDYNLFNTRAYHESQIVPEMQRLRVSQPDAIVYSNYVDAVWFYTRKPVVLLPTRNVPDLVVAYTGWPYDKPGYIVWFKPNEYKHYLAPAELSKFGLVKLQYSDPSGDIYFVQSR